MQNWKDPYKQNMVSYILLPEFHSQNFNSSFDNSLYLRVAHTHLTMSKVKLSSSALQLPSYFYHLDEYIHIYQIVLARNFRIVLLQHS